jgi:hypothetical protein
VTEIPVRCKNRSRSTRTVGHDEPESAVTIRRNQRSRWAGIPTNGCFLIFDVVKEGLNNSFVMRHAA